MPTRNAGLSTILLSGTFLASLAGFTLLAPQLASAQCVPNPVNANNQPVNCAGIEPNGLQNGGNAGTIVTVQDGAIINAPVLVGLDLLQGSTVDMFGNSVINANGPAGIVINGGNGIINMHDDSRINGLGAGTFGIMLNGDNNQIFLNDRASIDTSNPNIISGNNNSLVISRDAIVSSFASSIQFSNGSNSLSNSGTIISQFGFGILGDNGAGNSDTIVNSGTISSGPGVAAIDLVGGNDFLTLDTGSVINGDIDGGADLDQLTLVGSGSEDNVFLNFENALMNGDDWSLSGDSIFNNAIAIIQGRLGIDGNITVMGAGLTSVNPNGILGGSGQLNSPTVNSTGTIAPGPSGGVGVLTVVGVLNQTGGAFDIDFGQDGLDLLNLTNAGSILNLNNAPTINVTALDGVGSVSGIFAHADGGINGAVGTVNFQGNGGATVFQQDANNLRLVAVDGTQLVAGDAAGQQAGLDYLETVSGMQLSESRSVDRGGRHIWARGFGHFRDEEARDGNQAYDTRTAGTAFGGDFEVVDGLSLGGSLGYANTQSEVAFDTAETQIDGEFAAVYARYEIGQFFVSATASGGLQQFEVSREMVTRDSATSSDRDTAEAETDGHVVGGNVQFGANFDFGQGWRITPSAGASYQHQSIDGYRESGADRGNVEIEDHESDVLRLNAQLSLGKTIELSGFSLTPHVSAGVVRQINYGGTAKGTFSDGTEFEVALQDDDQVMGTAGAGIDVGIANGVGISLDYQGMYAGDTTDHAVIGGLSLKW